jgi:hypothetical protein
MCISCCSFGNTGVCRSTLGFCAFTARTRLTLLLKSTLRSSSPCSSSIGDVHVLWMPIIDGLTSLRASSIWAPPRESWYSAALVPPPPGNVRHALPYMIPPR